MRNILLIILLLTVGKAYSQNCPAPMPANIFKQKMNQLALQPNDQQKLQMAKNILPESCLLSSQIKDLAAVFNGDYYRLEFCKRAWRHAFDPSNFFDVYDSFSGFSSALRLYDYVSKANEIPGPDPHPHPGPTPPVTWYPNLPYPTPVGYKGVQGCALPMADTDFEFLMRPVILLRNDASRRTEALKLILNNCVSMSQAMKIATLFDLESNRLTFLREVFPKIHDLENFSYATEVFSNTPYKNEWIAYCHTVIPPANNPPAPPVVTCEVTSQDFEEIKKSIDNVSVNSTKLSLAKQIISTKKCFTVKQIAAIISLFSIESSRLEIAFFSYDYCINTADYYQLAETFSTTGSKNKIIEFLDQK